MALSHVRHKTESNKWTNKTNSEKTVQGRTPKVEFIYKKLCILTYLNFSHLQNTLYLVQSTYRDVFFHCSKQFLNSLILMLFNASAIFCFTSSTMTKHFPLRTLFIQRNKKKSLKMRSGDQGGWGTGVTPFLVKNCWTLSVVWAGAIINHPAWNGQMLWRSPHTQKSSLKPNAASCNNGNWYTDADEFLEPTHLPSRRCLYYKGPALQKVIPGFWVPPSMKVTRGEWGGNRRIQRVKSEVRGDRGKLD